MYNIIFNIFPFIIKNIFSNISQHLPFEKLGMSKEAQTLALKYFSGCILISSPHFPSIPIVSGKYPPLLVVVVCSVLFPFLISLKINKKDAFHQDFVKGAITLMLTV